MKNRTTEQNETPSNLRNDALLSRPNAASFLGIQSQTLAVWACNKRYLLPYIKVGRRVLYRQSDLDAFIESNLVGGHNA